MGYFKLPPISTLAGTTLINFFRIIKNEKISPQYYFKLLLTLLILLIATPFHIWEHFYFRNKLKKTKISKPSLFILGHWRSGTTFLHNMLCNDPDAAFMTTYHSVFPNNLASKWLFRTFMKLNMPEKRPSDNVKLHIDYPQEDEFAFCNINPNSYYKFFYFPSSYKDIYEKSIHLNGLSQKEIRRWFEDYDNMLRKVLLLSQGNRLIIKNPVNTARIKQLLKLYPDAKFLYIYRNPITVYLSTERFFKSLFPVLQLQKTTPELIENMIFDTYKKLMNDYVNTKSLIPTENLYELKFEDFEKDPLPFLKEIYTNLLKDDFSRVEKGFTAYFESQKSYKKNRYKLEREKLDKIVEHFGDYMKLYGYDIPDDFEIV